MHSIAPYTIRVHDNSLSGPVNEKYHLLSRIYKKDLLVVFNEYIERTKFKFKKIESNNSKRSFKFNEPYLMDRFLFGEIEYGEWGIKSKIMNVQTGQRNFQKEKHHSDNYTYHFCLHVPIDKTTAILLLHNIHGRGVKQLVDEQFKEHFKKGFNGLTPSIRPMSYEKVITEWYEHALVKHVKLTKYTGKIAGDDAVKSLSDSNIEVIYSPKKKGSSFGSLKRFIKSQNTDSTKLGRSIINWQESCHKVKLMVEHNNRTRTFSLKSSSDPISAIEIDDEVKMLDGNPAPTDMQKYMMELSSDMAEDLS